ncbi:hypothetical protein P7D22_14705 [Lichenihabitans sp. Uapishka_5]|uniref:hypothetical protein n=1 Tax=Lichenihabitans sp. Uapishka_5 TaxID=3037302 RepID=UPI0029E809B5|nr:hypothetical protein [Lichenihabitans sp. Uapishka_5]MDX7952419.1 hypothetical protein [Lichenihabitans sp. Uapishka_5]
MVADIVYVDDEPEGLLKLADAAHAGERFSEFTPPPPRAAEGVAAGANLWVFDFFNEEGQVQRPGLEGAMNGLSVFQQLRLLVGDARPPAIVVSNHLEQALGTEVNPDRRHVLAEEVGVEWVAEKAPSKGDVVAEILAIADAIAALRNAALKLSAASAEDYIDTLATLALGLNVEAPWRRAAVRDIGEWRPPAWRTSNGSRRAARLTAELPVVPELRAARNIVTWMIRQVLPYPSFLVRDHQLAVKFGVQLACLREALQAETPFAKACEACRYEGLLKDFDGRRWWIVGIDAMEWDLPGDRAARSAALQELFGAVPVQELDILDPVIVSDADLVETDDIAPMRECVRAVDEHFPAHAAAAWVRIEDAVAERALAAKVVPEDQGELKDRR